VQLQKANSWKVLAAGVLLAGLASACGSVSAETPRSTEATATAIQYKPSPTSTTLIAESTDLAIIPDILRVIQPGDASQITSPLKLLAFLPKAASIARAELYSADGRLLTRKLLAIDDSGRLELIMSFEVNSAQTGRLALSVDDRYGRLLALTSVEVELLRDGDSLIEVSEAVERVTIDAPEAGAHIENDTLNVAGLVRVAGGPLNIQLVTREGRVIATDDVYPQAAQDDERGYSATLTYTLQEAEWVRVVVSLKVSGVTWEVKSVEVWLIP
jgi:hypothetical protein